MHESSAYLTIAKVTQDRPTARPATGRLHKPPKRDTPSSSSIPTVPEDGNYWINAKSLTYNERVCLVVSKRLPEDAVMHEIGKMNKIVEGVLQLALKSEKAQNRLRSLTPGRLHVTFSPIGQASFLKKLHFCCRGWDLCSKTAHQTTRFEALRCWLQYDTGTTTRRPRRIWLVHFSSCTQRRSFKSSNARTVMC